MSRGDRIADGERIVIVEEALDVKKGKSICNFFWISLSDTLVYTRDQLNAMTNSEYFLSRFKFLLKGAKFLTQATLISGKSGKYVFCYIYILRFTQKYTVSAGQISM